MPRNAGRTPWNHELDLRLSQDLPAIGRGAGHGFQLTLDVVVGKRRPKPKNQEE